MKTAISILVLSLSLNAFAADTISGGGMAVSTCDYDAGAICSITWNGRQFVNNYDHGRQMQSAVSFDGRGENENPTEAGASYLTDGFIPHASSSVLLGHDVAAGVLSTMSHPAYWNPVNGKKVWDGFIAKRVQIGFQHAAQHATVLSNVIQHEVAFTIPLTENHTAAQFEYLTAYAPPQFSQFWTIDVMNGSASPVPLTDGPGEQALPIIFSTPDRQFAIAIYSPSLIGGGYGRWRFGDCVKFNAVARMVNPTPGATYRFKSYIVVGTLDTVASTMGALLQELGVVVGK